MGAILDLTYPVEEEKELRQQFAKLNIGTKKAFDINSFDKEVQEAIKEGVKEGFAEIEEFINKESSDPLSSTKIFGTREFLQLSAKEHYDLDNMFLPRAVASYMGLYGNSGSEASYPMYLTDAEGNPLNASENEYTLTLEAGNFPPVKAFWSLTMYDGITQLLIDNPLDRYLVNSPMMDDFVMNKDGSLTFYIQKGSPGEDAGSQLASSSQWPILLCHAPLWARGSSLERSMDKSPDAGEKLIQKQLKYEKHHYFSFDNSGLNAYRL